VVCCGQEMMVARGYWTTVKIVRFLFEVSWLGWKWRMMGQMARMG